jgi:predicted TIM-barrel fold metal-dependent hydrolase
LRSKIDEYDHIDNNNWEYYKKIVNPYEIVYTQRKYDDFPESLSVYKPLSRSYFKMIEMLFLSDLFDNFPKEPIVSGHVCEGPGGFIEGIIDECNKRRRIFNGGIAMTLNSQSNKITPHTNIPGWKRATQFLQKNQNIKILHGADYTGNIMNVQNQEYFIQYCKKNPSQQPHIFTGDGGFDFSTDYPSQEKNTLI